METPHLTTESPEFQAVFPYKPKFFTYGNHKLHYVDEGSGPVLLLLHACPMWSFSFRYVIREFSRNHRVIAVDQMGFGLSDKPERFDYHLENHIEMMEAFIVDKQLKDITFIAHGRGCTIAMAYAVRYPENVSAFIIMNTMAFSDFELPYRLRICRFKWAADLLIRKLKLLFWGILLHPRLTRESYFIPFREEKRLNPLLRFVENMPCHPEEDSAQSMYEIEAGLWLLRDKPAAIFWAKHDWLYSRRSLRKWKQYFPEAEVHILKKTGRFLTEDNPEPLNDLIRDFLERNRC
ncbi:MAG: alpha/beta fold hydrolase [Lentisphaeria bacterium]|nr:alpha/beta fold hydrolase [Lentisphaeria bacterium]